MAVPVEIAPCPGCKARLSVSATDLGADIECPYCKAVYVATRAGPDAIVAPVVRPSRRGRDDDDRPSRRRRDEEDDDFDNRPSRRKRRRRTQESQRVTAALLALLLGGWGIHKFVLGYTNAGIIQLVLSVVTCGFAGVVPFIEGIIYLTKTDDEFIETYQEGRKEWF